MLRRLLPASGTFAVFAALVIAPPAAADHEDEREYVDVEIEGLSGDLKTAPDGWYLYIEYDVEVEDRLPETPLDLVLFVSEHGRSLVYEDKPIDAVIRLDQPSEIDDEYDFQETIRLHVPGDAVVDPYNLRVHALVFFAGTDKPLASKARSVHYYYARPHYRRSDFFGYGVGYGIGHRYYRHRSHYRFGVGVHYGRRHHAHHRYRFGCRR